MTEYAWAKEAFDGVASDFDKASSSGTSSIQIDNASAGKIESLRIYGNSVQDGTPSIDAPAEIQSIGDLVTEGEYKGKYKIPITVSGKNLFDQNLFNTDVGVNAVYVTYEIPNGTYVMSTDFSGYHYANVFIFAGTVNSGISTLDNGVTSDTPRKLVVSDGHFTVAYRTANAEGDHNPKNFNWQLEKGTTATKYEPYTSTTTNIYLNEPLRKVGDAVDHIDFKNKKVVRNVGTMEHTTNTTAIKGKTATESGVYRNYIQTSPLMKGGINTDGLCTTLATNKKEWASLIAPSVRFGQVNAVIYIMTSAQMATNQDLYNYVTNNGKNKCIYYYQLSNFTEEKIEIPDILTTKGTNCITVRTGTIPSKIEIIYNK